MNISLELAPDGLLFLTHDPYHQWVYICGAGQTIGNVHSPIACNNAEHCVIHNPSDHHMREWPTNWRDGGAFDIKGPHMERLCPHGIGHPDPDDLAFWKAMGQDYSVHGCDGCCNPAYSG